MASLASRLAVAVVLLVVVAFVVAVVGAIATFAMRVRPKDVDWLAGDFADVRAHVVYEKYLRRHWRTRTLGWVAGLAVTLVAAIRWQPDAAGVTVGIGNGPIGADLLVGVLAGATLGTLAGETYRLRRRGGARREARLEARPSRPRPGLTWTARAVALACVVVAVVATVVWGKAGSIGGAVLAVVIVGLAEATQAAVTDRPRFTDDLVDEVDQRLRAFAGTSVAWLELSGAVLGFGWAVSAFNPTDGTGSLGAAVFAVEAVCLVASVVALLRSSGRAPRGWSA